MLKISASQPHTSANKLDDGTAGGGADVDGFGSGSNEKSSKSRNEKSAKSRKSTILGNSKAMEEPKFLTSKTREAFNLLRQAFTKAPILQHFDPECHIRIETNASGYAIGGVFS